MVQREYRYEEVLGGLGIKDSVLSLLWLGLNPRPRNFCMPQVQPKKKRRDSSCNLGCWMLEQHRQTLPSQNLLNDSQASFSELPGSLEGKAVSTSAPTLLWGDTSWSFFFIFLWLHLRHMEVPGRESNWSRISHSGRSLWRCQIRPLIHGVRPGTESTSSPRPPWVLNLPRHKGNSKSWFLYCTPFLRVAPTVTESHYFLLPLSHTYRQCGCASFFSVFETLSQKSRSRCKGEF